MYCPPGSRILLAASPGEEARPVEDHEVALDPYDCGVELPHVGIAYEQEDRQVKNRKINRHIKPPIMVHADTRDEGARAAIIISKR
jgi:hypothetical protein